jgi:two-component system alkaline phosphatase synthesis response regulator PhoP
MEKTAKKKILVVDDEQDIVTLIKSRLELSGYEVIAAYDGNEGLEKARKEKPDMVILDIMLPKIDGFQVCRMLKFDSDYKNIPVMLFSARAGEHDKATGEEAGADAYLVKPFDSNVLIAKVKELLKD